jgi:hypothetical protein
MSDYAACTTGIITADWQLTEPSGEPTNFTAMGVVVGGVMVLAASPKPGSDGYRDPSTTNAPGAGASVGLLVPSPGQLCVTGVTQLKLAATVVGQD